MMRLRGVLELALAVLALTGGMRSSAAGSSPILFTKGLMSEVKAEDGPAQGQPVRRIELCACPGEFEPFSLAIRGTGDGNWKFQVSDLRAGGEAIPASAVELAMVWWEETRGYLGQYARVTDWVLAPGARGVRLTAGQTAWVWLTVGVPADTKPGRYEGSFALEAEEGGATLSVPLIVEVLPVNLEPVPGVQFCLLQTVAFGQSHDAMSRAQRRPAARQLYRELRDHGMTCIAEKCSDWNAQVLRKTGSGYNPGHFEGLEACVETALEAGLRGPVLWYMSSLINGVKGGRNYAQYDGKCDNWNETRDLANLKEIVQEVRNRGRAKGWPEVVFYTVDEPGTQTDDRQIRALRLGTILPKSLQVVHDLGARGAATISEPVDEKHNRLWVNEGDELRKLWDRSRPYCHVRLYAYGYPQGRTNVAAEKADCEKRGHEMWFYHNPAIMGRDRYCARLYFGLWGWKVGARGLTAWTYPGGRTVQFELVREGIDDLKYLAMLEKLIGQNRGSAEDRAQAGAFLNELRQSIPLDANGAISDWAKAAEAAARLAKPDDEPASPDLTALKRRLADFLKRLAP